MANTRRYKVRLYTSAYVDIDVDAVDLEDAATAARTEASKIQDEFLVYLPEIGDVVVEVETLDWEFMHGHVKKDG